MNGYPIPLINKTGHLRVLEQLKVHEYLRKYIKIKFDETKFDKTEEDLERKREINEYLTQLFKGINNKIIYKMFKEMCFQQEDKNIVSNTKSSKEELADNEEQNDEDVKKAKRPKLEQTYHLRSLKFVREKSRKISNTTMLKTLKIGTGLKR